MINTTAKLSLPKNFQFHLPIGYIIVDETPKLNDPNVVILTIRGPFPPSIPDGSRVMANITTYVTPKNYKTLQWYYNRLPHGDPIEMDVSDGL